MKVDEMLRKLERTIEDIKEKYCWRRDCQEWDCDYCPYEIDEEE